MAVKGAVKEPVMGTATVLATGAEARIERGTFLGRSVVRKVRLPKTYRHPVLDARIRDARTRDEANLLLAARRADVPVPILYDIDRAGTVLTMEHVVGPLLRDRLQHDDDATAEARLRWLGTLVARLHASGVTHGDLTTSNVLVPDPTDPQSLVVIDFGLGLATMEDEPRGVDLHLMEEALEATEPRGAALFAALLEGYRRGGSGGDGGGGGIEGALRRLEDIRERGRYRT